MGVFEFISAIFGTIAATIGGVLFYKQNKRAKEIDNDSKLAAEWEKLYREQKTITDRNSERIDDLTSQVMELTARVEKAEPYICTNIACELRQNNFKNNKKSEK